MLQEGQKKKGRGEDQGKRWKSTGKGGGEDEIERKNERSGSEGRGR